MLTTRLALLSVLILFLALPARELVKVDSVIDVDTLVLENGEEAWLIGIYIPEIVHPSKPDQYYGKEARENNRGLGKDADQEVNKDNKQLKIKVLIS